ncbi:Fic family protein [Pajaroellobacter abortibovis]|uniref:Fic family protein n=1 Tax=Pajaroellobacter abortibovis TaxID=1882918 RepID=UPI001560620A|nr:Fic family protein [Pajaroellobacter abortibovis]
MDLSWIAHDSAIEGFVYTFEELEIAFSCDPSSSSHPMDANMEQIYGEIKNYRAALHFIRQCVVDPNLSVTTDIIKGIYAALHPEAGEAKSIKYRKETPQHRLYFHEYAPPDKISSRMAQIIDWVNDPIVLKKRGPFRMAVRAHYDLLRVFPFPQNSGKVARLFLNLLLLRNGYPPAIIHSTERQRYYEALKGSITTMETIVLESIENGLASIQKLIRDYEH